MPDSTPDSNVCRLEALYRVSHALGSILDLDALLQTVIDPVMAIAGAERGFLKRGETSEYARKVGLTYRTVWKMYHRGELDAYQLPSGTIVVRDEAVDPAPEGVALYARVSSHDQKADAERQLDRLRDYAAARGYQVVKEVIEIASGLNDKRPQFQKLLSDGRIGGILVEHKDRATRFGYNDIACLLEAQKRRIEAINATDTQDELVDDFVALITSMAARIYGRRSNKRRAEAIRECVERVYEVS